MAVAHSPRKSTQPLRFLYDREHTISIKLSDLVDLNILKLDNISSTDDLKNAVHERKELWYSYKEVVTELIDSLKRNGSLTEADDFSREVMQHKTDYRKCILALNRKRQELGDDASEFDTSSTASDVSQHLSVLSLNMLPTEDANKRVQSLLNSQTEHNASVYEIEEPTTTLHPSLSPLQSYATGMTTAVRTLPPFITANTGPLGHTQSTSTTQRVSFTSASSLPINQTVFSYSNMNPDARTYQPINNYSLNPPSRLTSSTSTYTRPSVPPLDNHGHIAQPTGYDSKAKYNHMHARDSIPDCPFMVPTASNSRMSYDSSTMFLIRKELMPQSKIEFNGEAHQFNNWTHRIAALIEGLPISSMNIMEILSANCTGEPRALIEDYRTIARGDPTETLNNIWRELYKKYGTSDVIFNQLEKKVTEFPPIKHEKDKKRFIELHRLCRIIYSNIMEVPDLQSFDTGSGIRTIIRKFPPSSLNKWTSRSASRKRNYGMSPRFKDLLDFLESEIDFLDMEESQQGPLKKHATSFVTGTEALVVGTPVPIEVGMYKTCIVHGQGKHSTNECNIFCNYSFNDKQKLVQSGGLCYRCLGSHLKRDCREDVVCRECHGGHCTAMHNPNHISMGHPTTGRYDSTRTAGKYNPVRSAGKYNATRTAGRYDPVPDRSTGNSGVTLCAQFCHSENSGKSCSKILLVDVWAKHKPASIRCYALVDEQSSTSFVVTKLADQLGLDGPTHDYTLTTMNGLKTFIECKIISGMVIKGVGENTPFQLPQVRTHDFIPNCKEEIASPDIVRAHSHISRYANRFNPVDSSAEVLLLIGRDCSDLIGTKCYGNVAPYVHKTPLGWALVGSACPYDKNNKLANVTTMKTALVHEHFNVKPSFNHAKMRGATVQLPDTFATNTDDELPGLSLDDSHFLKLISEGISINRNGSLQMPLPFRSTDPHLPDNSIAVYHRTKNTLSRLKTDHDKLSQCLTTMGKYLSAKHVEEVPVTELQPQVPGKAWWLPVFPVTHPKKGKVRLVFDSSASYGGTSLNKQLLQGPDYNNRLTGVMLRFRQGPIGFSADIESMFHSFQLDECDRDFVRFYWFRDNNPTYPLVQFRARVHIFGNTASPAIANFGLRYTARQSATDAFPKSKQFIEENFYVDDGLGGADTAAQAINVLQGARSILQRFNIRLHKIASNSKEVMGAFPTSELVDVATIDLREPNIHQTLGVSWDLATDHFTFKVSIPDRPFTRRGVLSVVNSLFDPQGVASPVILTGRLIQRKLMLDKDACSKTDTQSQDWDDPLPTCHLQVWQEWLSTLPELNVLCIPRSYYPIYFGKVIRQELHVFSDASIEAIGYVIYLRSINEHNDIHVSFVTGNSKVAPRATVSVPRLELCAAQEATLAALEVCNELNMDVKCATFYSDSQIVLGYLRNSTRKFSRYVSRRVEIILNVASCKSWHYVQTDINPADIASRPHDPISLANTIWLKGPTFLWNDCTLPEESASVMVNHYDLPEADLKSFKVSIILQDRLPLTGAIDRLSCWTKLLRVGKFVCSALAWLDRARQRLKVSLAPRPPGTQVSETFVVKAFIRTVQLQTGLSAGRGGSPDADIASLSPFIDDEGIIRVGGRLRHAFIPLDGRHPILIPRQSPISTLLVRHYHARVKHQGRVLTQGAIVEAGYHIVGCRKLIDKLLKSCVICRRLRASSEIQQMADLPPDRLEESPPFTNTSVDLFGPFHVTDGISTRRTTATKKVWAVIFVCQVSRAVHLDTVYSLDTTAFCHSLRRFFALRGMCKRLRSDNGTNFTATKKEMSGRIDTNTIHLTTLQYGCQWIMNPPGASHHGGSWERKIGAIRRILEASLLEIGPRSLTRDEFNTVLQEAASIVNNTPLTPISTAGDPTPITPAMLLLLRDHPNPAPFESFTPADLNSYGRKRWKRVQYIAEQFWARWRKYYLPKLVARDKWHDKKVCLTIGDIVLIKEKCSRRNNWPTAVVVSTKFSADGLVRSATVRLASNRKMFTRCVNDLVVILRKDSN